MVSWRVKAQTTFANTFAVAMVFKEGFGGQRAQRLNGSTAFRNESLIEFKGL
jgi:hypothetical protein